MRASLANVLDDDEWQTLATPQMLCSNDMATLVLLRLCEEIVSVEIGLCLIHSAKTYTELSKGLERQHSSLLPASNSSFQYLPRLRSLSLLMYDALLLNEFEIQLDNLPDLASLLLFPSLRTLRCEALDFCENPFGVSRYRKVADLSQWLADHSRSSIWEVYLNNCHVPDEKTLLEFMTFVPDLELFHFTASDYSLGPHHDVFIRDPFQGPGCDQMAALIRDFAIPTRELRFDIIPETWRVSRHDTCQVHEQSWCTLSPKRSLEVVGLPSLLLGGEICHSPLQHRASPLSWMLPSESAHL
jgi:hypothetical protein